MSTDKESTTHQKPTPINDSQYWSNPSIFLLFVQSKFADQRLFSVSDFYNEWKTENTNNPPLAAIEKNLDILADQRRIEKLMFFDYQPVNVKDADSNDNDDDEKSQDKDIQETYKYDYIIKYRYIPPSKAQIEHTMGSTFNKIKNELKKAPLSIISLSKNLDIHHQKVRAVIDVLACLGIVKVSTKGSICVWDQEQENRIHQVKDSYQQIIKLKENDSDD